MKIIIYITIGIIIWILISQYINKKQKETSLKINKNIEDKLLEINKKRKEELLDKYAGDIEAVEMIINKTLWQGQTSEQLIDSIGNPIDIDKKVLKTKSKEVWKYHQTGKGRFSLKITIEDGLVTGWDKKS